MIRLCVAYDQQEYRWLANQHGWVTSGVGRVVVVTTVRNAVSDVLWGLTLGADEIFWSDRCYDGRAFVVVEQHVLSRIR